MAHPSQGPSGATDPPPLGDDLRMLHSLSAAESTRTAGGIAALLGLQLVLVLWWLVFVTPGGGWWRSPGDGDEASAAETRTLLALLGLLALAVAILALTMVERHAERRLVLAAGARPAGTTSTKKDLPVRTRVGADLVMAHFALTLLVLLAYVLWPGAGTVTEALVALVVLGGLLVGVAVAAPPLLDPVKAPDLAVQPPTSTADGAAPPGVTVAMSGGGIRASAFTLGAYNALADRAVPDQPGQPGQPDRPGQPDPTEPRLVAVSGGSYVAAALALVRSFRAADGAPIDGISWREAYALSSPEMARLRRHTRDLVEPFRYLVGGLLNLVCGAALNLVIVLGFTALLAWLLAWLYATAGILYVEVRGADHVLRLVSPFVDRPDGTALAWWTVVGVLLVLALLFVAVSLVIYSAEQRVNRTGAVDSDRWTRFVGARTVVTSLLVGWAVVALGIPVLVYGLAQVVLTNQPTRPVASVVDALGFATADLCATQARAEVSAAYDEAAAQALLAPGQRRTVEAGSCGSSVSVAATYPPAEGAPLTDEQRRSLFDQASGREQPGSGSSFAARLTALVGLLSAAGVGLRRVAANADAPLNRWQERLKRLVLAWLPLTVGVALLLWFFLSRVFVRVVDHARLADLTPALLTLAALVVAAWTDANTTSLHGYYRQRLSSAFAVGRVLRGGVVSAAELPYEKVYTFSALRHGGLHVATTANVRAYDQVPTHRGGLPFVLSPEGVRMTTATGEVITPMRDYEEAAGLGRVTVMAAVATSGAAVSPMAGRFAATVAPFRMLLTLFNVRVGSWVRNPAWHRFQTVPPTMSFWYVLFQWPAAPWLIGRPGAAQVLVEAAGRSSVTDRWLYLSDGGHLDNTGLVEAVRLHRTAQGTYAGRILVVDASNDALGTWSAVGDALAVVRSDLGVELDCVMGAPGLEDQEPAPAAPPDGVRDLAVAALRRWLAPKTAPHLQPFMRLYRGRDQNNGLQVMVVKAVRPAADEDVPESVRSFTLLHPQFPRASTTRQDFGDLEFEAYRALGEHYAGKALRAWAEWADEHA